MQACFTGNIKWLCISIENIQQYDQNKERRRKNKNQ